MFQKLQKKANIYKFAQKLQNEKLKEAIQDYSLKSISDEKKIDFNQHPTILQNINNSSVIIIDYYPKSESSSEDKHFIICFKKTIILIKQTIISTIQQLFKINNKIKLCFLDDTKIFFDTNIQIEYQELINNKLFEEELYNFNHHFIFIKKNDFLQEMREIICPSLSAYFIKESYNKFNTNRITDFYSNQNKSAYSRKIKEDEFIELRQINNGNICKVCLIYHIEDEKLYAIKKQSVIDDEFEKLRNREIDNYLKINHPFLPKFIGLTQEKQDLVFEYINGQTLSETNISEYSETDIFSIIIQILSVFEYFHENHFIYRDLKPNNIMIDFNKIAIIIDFDRMIEEKEINSDYNREYNLKNRTINFATEYAAPEINSGQFTNKCDIYSIGKILNYIMNHNNIDLSNNYISIEKLMNQCCEQESDKRLSISEIINHFYYISQIKNIFLNNIDIKSKTKLGELNITMNRINVAIRYFISAANHNCPRAQYNLFKIYYDGKYISRDINKSIHYLFISSNQNFPEAQYSLGFIYYEGKYIEQDINKAIYYFSLAANKNISQAQFYLGVIFDEGKYISKDINKAIYYYSLAANQNFPEAQYSLGCIYYEGKYIEQDINKAIYYFSLAANQNILQAQFNIGAIYYEGKYIAPDINIAIYYFIFAATQNEARSQFYLGCIYYEGKYIEQDINIAIYYFQLSANQNFPQAQHNLAKIYYEGKYIKQDINKAIYYYSLSANQNCPQSQHNLAKIYYEGKYIKQDINKAIHYYSLAANQNYPQAQYDFANIYYEGKYVKQDINKAIHYYSLAANQNVLHAQYNLGFIYSEGINISRDINKGIHYLSLAAKQNDPQAQFYLGLIYTDDTYNKQDINKAIYYYLLAANQNDHQAQNNLGFIYYDGKYIPRDINKAIYYLSRAANQNYPQAQFNLGFIYYEGKYIAQDISKAFYYYSLAAKQNYPKALHILGLIYYEGEYVRHDINKTIYYLSLAAKQNDPRAQFNLGNIYYNYLKKIKDGIFWILESSEKRYIKAYFFLGFLYQEGKNITKDIKKSIHYYKEASSFNNQYAKNNLGIIYKHGIDNEIEKNIGNSEIYFSESIKQKKDKVSMYNLAHLYIYEEGTTESIDKSINLLIDSLNLEFYRSAILLLIVLFKKYDGNIENIANDLSRVNKKIYNLLFSGIEFNHIILLFNDKSILEEFYQKYKSIDFIYNQSFDFIVANYLYDFKNKQKPQGKGITQDFYDGFNCVI